jgi:sulfide dehydrogenase cytochrome subunit
MDSKYLLAVLSVCVLFAGVASAETDVSGQRLAATCANCHGTNGVSAGGAIPGLAGKSKDFIVTQMQEFKTGKRNPTVMQQLAKGYTDQEIALMAVFFSQQSAQKK